MVEIYINDNILSVPLDRRALDCNAWNYRKEDKWNIGIVKWS